MINHDQNSSEPERRSGSSPIRNEEEQKMSDQRRAMIQLVEEIRQSGYHGSESSSSSDVDEFEELLEQIANIHREGPGGVKMITLE